MTSENRFNINLHLENANSSSNQNPFLILIFKIIKYQNWKKTTYFDIFFRMVKFQNLGKNEQYIDPFFQNGLISKSGKKWAIHWSFFSEWSNFKIWEKWIWIDKRTCNTKAGSRVPAAHNGSHAMAGSTCLLGTYSATVLAHIPVRSL